MFDDTKMGSRTMNPWVLHLQKLGLELKCPLCLKLLAGPVLLPCDHVFCNACVPEPTPFDPECPVCKSQYTVQDARSLRFMENIVSIYRSLDAAFCANLQQSQSGEGSDRKNLTRSRCTMIEEGEAGKLKDGIEYGGSQNLDFPPPSSQESNPRIEEYRNLHVEVNQAEQLLPESPPSFGVAKGLDNENSDHSPEIYTGQMKRNFDGSKKWNMPSTSASETTKNSSKRPKKLLYGVTEMDVSHDCPSKSVDQPTRDLPTSSSNAEPKSGTVHQSSKPHAISGESSGDKTICEFCQSSRISEATGEMLHYLKGKQVGGDDIFRSNVIHVHSSCIEWAPQVYYETDLVKNLKAELARGAKIKCTKCGLKGAALGCYVKSCRRSYHVPCARELPKCRWDYDDYLLLCPAHSSVKFPREKSRSSISKDQAKRTEITSLQPNSTAEHLNETKEWILCGSALSSDEKFLLVQFASKIGAAVSKFWRPEVTHVIASTNENGACTRTLKVLMGILNGKWILTMDWIKACMETKQAVAEEPYEICLDNHGCHDGPKTGRLRALDNAPKLFDGLRFYFSGEFVRGYKEDLQNLVTVAGGAILTSEDELAAQSCKDHSATSRTLVVYNIDPPQGCVLGEEVSIIWQRLSEAEEVASKTGSQVVGHTWLLESIAAYKLQPLIS